MQSTSLIRGHELGSDLYSRWMEIQRTAVGLDNPCFHPEFTRLIAELREDVEIAVLEDGNQPVGFFPFRRIGKKTAQPVGWRLSDFHGPVVESGFDYCPLELLKACRLDEWRFDCMPEACTAMVGSSSSHEEVAFIDLSQGFDKYEADCRETSASLFSENRRKTRKIEREVGPVRFEMHSTRPADLQALMRWKSQQHQRTGVLDLFQFDWFTALMERLSQAETDGFSGRLSTFSAGDHLIGVHLGLHSNTVRHMWYGSYDRGFSKYSPGIMMRLALFRALGEQGLQRVDLGGGEFDYKDRIKSGTHTVHQGCVSRSRMRRTATRGWIRTRDWARNSFLRGPASQVAAILRPLRDRKAFH